jgi:predicted HicB family RNase H-like nuclease
MTPEHHRLIAIAAKTGKSINAWMDEVLGEAAKKVLRA